MNFFASNIKKGHGKLKAQKGIHWKQAWIVHGIETNTEQNPREGINQHNSRVLAVEVCETFL